MLQELSLRLGEVHFHRGVTVEGGGVLLGEKAARLCTLSQVCLPVVSRHFPAAREILC